MPFVQNEGSKCVSVMWYAMPARPARPATSQDAMLLKKRMYQTCVDDEVSISAMPATSTDAI